MTKKIRVREILMGLAAALLASTAFADEVWTGELLQGFQANLQTTSQAKYQEYLSRPDGAVMNGNLEYDGSEGILDLGLSDMGGFNRKADLGLEYEKNLTIDVNFEQFQHLYSNTANTIYSNPSPDLYLLPGSLQLANQGQSSALVYQNLLNQENNYARPLTVGLQDSIMGAEARYQVSPELELQVGGNQKWRDGSRPLGLIGSSTVELPEQLNQTTTNGDVKAEYDGKNFAIRAGYELSYFDNSLPSMIWSNPTIYQSIPNNSSLNQYALDPSNQLHRFSFSAETDCLPETRIAADVALGYETQNQAFLPYTINPYDTVGTGGPAANLVSSLPATSLNGMIQTFTQNYVVTSRPWSNFVITARYKDYQLADMNPNILFPGYVSHDGSWGAGNILNDNYSTINQSLGGSANWTLLRGLSVNGGYSSNWMNLTDREVTATHEDAWKWGLDLKPLRGVDLKGEYTWTQRVASQDGYISDDYLQNVGSPAEYGEAVNPGLRRYDVADRQVQNITSKATLTVLKNVWFACSWTTGYEYFNPGSESLNDGVTANENQQYGLLSDNHDFLTFTAHWQPLDGVELTGTVDQQVYNYVQEGTTASASVQGYFSDWVLNQQESTTYLTFGGDFQLSPKVQMDANWTLTNSQGIFNVVEWNSATQNNNLPNTTYWMEDYVFGITYHINDTWSLRGSYLVEIYNENDPLNDGLNNVQINPATGGLDALFLGGANAPYTAQMMTVALNAKI